MSKFTDLSTEQQALVSAWVQNQFRPTARAMAQSLAALAGLDQGTWLPTISSLVTALDAGTAIPDQTGLAGAQQLIREDIIAFMTAAEEVLAANNTSAQIAAYNKIGGI